MDTRTRILTIRLSERLSRAPELRKKLGITVKNDLKESNHDFNYQENRRK